MLADIVSKNGNLLLNIPVRGDGTIDTDEVKFLEETAAWMDVNSEAIFGTRPWVVYGEGPSTTAQRRQGGGSFNEGRTRYTAEDLRFTIKGDVLYAIGLVWPAAGGKLTIKSLASNSPRVKGKIGAVHLLGQDGPLETTRDANGLTVTLPAPKPGTPAHRSSSRLPWGASVASKNSPLNLHEVRFNRQGRSMMNSVLFAGLLPLLLAAAPDQPGQPKPDDGGPRAHQHSGQAVSPHP